MIRKTKRAATRNPSLILHPSSFILLLLIACTSERSGSTLRDDVGRDVAVPATVTRVITLAPNLTELVYAAGAESRLVATDDNSDTPAAARELPKVGGMEPNVEKIVALRPDLVIASTEGNQPSLGPALASVDIPLFVVRTDRLDEIAPALVRIGSLTGSAGAEQAAEELRRAIEAQRRKRTKAPRVLFAVWADPLYAGGRNTFIDDLFVLTGGTNSVETNGWPQLSLERLIASPPDLVLYPGRTVPRAHLERLFQAQPALLDRVELVPVDDNLFTRPGPRVAEAAAALNGILDRWEASH